MSSSSQATRGVLSPCFCGSLEGAYCLRLAYSFVPWFDRSLGWVASWLVGLLAGWLVTWLVVLLACGSLLGCLVGWLVGWLFGWLVGWLVGLFGWLAGLFVRSFLGCLRLVAFVWRPVSQALPVSCGPWAARG